MHTAVQAFLTLLDAPERAQTQLTFDAAERFNWSYVPMERQGLPIAAMTMDQRRALYTLLRSGLSTAGYLKASAIIQLEPILKALEINGPTRDSERFYLTVFGTPGQGLPWGWRFEGHHVSLNFTIADDGSVATTPMFFGANPAEVPLGPYSGWRVLAAEEDLGRQLLGMLDATQQRQAIITATAPGDIVTGHDRIARLAHFEGLPVRAMTTAQHDLLLRLVGEYVHNLADDLARAHLDRITQAGVEHLHFAWAGSAERGAGHYYRIHGPTTLIEYDNTQNDANHVHTVVRDLEEDWGGDVLAQHYEQADHHA